MNEQASNTYEGMILAPFPCGMTEVTNQQGMYGFTNSGFSQSRQPTYEETSRRLRESGVRKGRRGYETVYLIESNRQFELLREHMRVGHAEGTRYPDGTAVDRYPNVGGMYQGEGWYQVDQVPLQVYDPHERQRYDYDIRLLLPTVEELWEDVIE